MKNILIICAEERDKRELKAINAHQNYRLHYDTSFSDLFENLWQWHDPDYCSDLNILQIVDSRVQEFKKLSLHGILSTGDYPGCLLSSVLAHEMGLKGPSPQNILLSQHKYYARKLQQEATPEAVPHFTLINPLKAKEVAFSLAYPFFIKPVKSCFSAYAQAIHSHTILLNFLEDPMPPKSFLRPFDQLLKSYTNVEFDSYHLLAEDLLEGVQCTLDGFSYKGHIEIMGIVDSIMFSGTISFERFEYPSRLPAHIQVMMGEIAKKCILNMGLDNTLFNIEYIYNPSQNIVKIIEINTRMSSQHADLFEKVDGTNSYAVALDIATETQPQFFRHKGRFKVAASFVLRSFKNQKVLKIPTSEQLENIQSLFPECRIEICAREGKKLSDELQDDQSFRYGLIHLGAQCWEELFNIFEECKAMLQFEFEPII